MHRYYFPRCHVDGPIEPPVEFNYGYQGAIPKKCSGCEHQFEGECLRGGEQVGRYLKLDYGPCGLPGETDPVLYENEFIQSKKTIPRKCGQCVYLKYGEIRGFYCGKDSEKWGDRGRGLDWGNWQPDVVYFDLPLPKVTTHKMCEAVSSDALIDFVAEYRRVNPGRSIEEAKNDFALMRAKLDGA